MGAIRLSSLLAVAIALTGSVLYAQAMPRGAAVGGRALAGATAAMPRVVAPRAAFGSTNAPGSPIMLPQLQRSVMPPVTPVTPVQVVPPAVFPFGASTVFVGDGFMTFPSVPTGIFGGNPQLSAIGFAAGVDLMPPVTIGGSFLTSNFLFQTPFGPAFAQSQQAPFVTVGSNIVNVGAQPSFFGPFFPVPTFGVPFLPSPFISGFGAITVP